MTLNPSSHQPMIGPDGIARENPVIAYTEKVIEEEQLQLRKYIQENYSKIRDVERELENLNMEMKLTSGPKKAALEHLRKKIEISTEKISVAKQKEEQARQAWEAATKAVQDEEALKQKLCEDLNQLVHESSNTQLSRLEELKRRLEALNPGRASTSTPIDGNSGGPAQISATVDASPIPNAQQPNPTVSENVNMNGTNASPTNGHNQQQAVDGETRGKKKVQFQGKGRGIGAVPKGRGAASPGWTGAGFDVDGRT